MYLRFENDRDTGSKIVDWQLNIIDYIVDQLKDVPHGVPIIFTKKDIYDNVCPERETWCPFGSRTFWTIPDMLELCGYKVNSGWMYTMDTFGYFAAKKIKQCSKRPAAYGRGSFLLLDKIDEVRYTISVEEYLDVRVKSVYAFLRVN